MAVLLVTVSPSFALAQGVLDGEREFLWRQCQHDISIRNYARQDLLDAINRYRDCVAGGPETSCQYGFRALVSARDHLTQVDDEAHEACDLAGVIIPTIPPR